MTHDCGHNHQPNPYTDPQRADSYEALTMSLLRLMILNVGTDLNACGRFAALTGMCLSGDHDPIPTYRALLWEVADCVHVMTNGKEPEFTGIGCQDPSHDHHDPDLLPEQEFGDKVLRAFFAAASIGDHQSAVNVVDSIVAEYANNQDVPPPVFVAAFFSNAMLSLAMTTRFNHPDPMSLILD